jgi:cytochrome c biogenesis protein CcmG/thiol:disulfide interchange protein DsbE
MEPHDADPAATDDDASGTDTTVIGGTHLARNIAIGLAVLLGLFVALLATRPTSGEREKESELFGQVAPAVSGSTLDGSEVISIDDYRGRWVVLNFFASWCTPCLLEHDDLVEFYDAHRDEGDAVLIGVTFNDATKDAQDFFASEGGGWPVIDDQKNAFGVAYGVAKLPETFVIAPDGVVVYRFAGQVTRKALDEVIAFYESGGRTGDDGTVGDDDGEHGA